MKKKIIISALVILIFVTAGGGFVYFDNMNKYKKIISDISVSTPDLSKLEDGIYTGKMDALVIGATVEVVIKENRIEDIVLTEHKNERGMAAEQIITDVLHEQSLNVDAISGATNSSKVILKAIENALV